MNSYASGHGPIAAVLVQMRTRCRKFGPVANLLPQFWCSRGPAAANSVHGLDENFGNGLPGGRKEDVSNPLPQILSSREPVAANSVHGLDENFGNGLPGGRFGLASACCKGFRVLPEGQCA